MLGAITNNARPSRSFIPVDWHPTDCPSEITDGWREFPPVGKPYEYAGIIAVQTTVMQELRNNKSTPGELAEGVAILRKRRVWAALLPAGFGRVTVAQQECVSVARPIGNEPLRVMPVFINLRDSGLLVPETSDVQMFSPTPYTPGLRGVYAQTPLV